MAQERVFIDEAYAGDIIGVFDPGIFHIGDTLCGGKKNFNFEDIPMFPAEHFAYVSAKDASKRKQFLKGIQQIAEEGAIQVFKQPNIGVETLMIGVAGVLQFEVLEYRLKNEYRADITMHLYPCAMACHQKGAGRNLGLQWQHINCRRPVSTTGHAVQRPMDFEQSRGN
jgi:peptide chain release factor 3